MLSDPIEYYHKTDQPIIEAAVEQCLKTCPQRNKYQFDNSFI